MDGENNGKPYEQMDDLEEQKPLFLVQHPVRDWGIPYKPPLGPLGTPPIGSWTGETPVEIVFVGTPGSHLRTETVEDLVKTTDFPT